MSTSNSGASPFQVMVLRLSSTLAVAVFWLYLTSHSPSSIDIVLPSVLISLKNIELIPSNPIAQNELIVSFPMNPYSQPLERVRPFPPSYWLLAV